MYRDRLKERSADFVEQQLGRARQGQAEQLSKSRKEFLATTYKPLFTRLYSCSAFYSDTVWFVRQSVIASGNFYWVLLNVAGQFA